MRNAVFVLICLVLAPFCRARTITVDDDGPADFNNIQGAIDDANDGGTAEASKSYFGEPVCETIVAGDINGDCKVDLADFAEMAGNWLIDCRLTTADPACIPK